jgi:hypothetical protein
MWVFSATCNKNYFSYLVGSHLLMKKPEITEKMPILPGRHLHILLHRVYRGHLSP